METSAGSEPSQAARGSAGPAAPAAARRWRRHEAIDGTVRCACCGRFPLVGEIVVHHRNGGGEGEWACERCEASGRAEGIGPARTRVRIRSLGGAANVRRAV